MVRRFVRVCFKALDPVGMVNDMLDLPEGLLRLLAPSLSAFLFGLMAWAVRGTRAGVLSGLATLAILLFILMTIAAYRLQARIDDLEEPRLPKNLDELIRAVKDWEHIARKAISDRAFLIRWNHQHSDQEALTPRDLLDGDLRASLDSTKHNLGKEIAVAGKSFSPDMQIDLALAQLALMTFSSESHEPSEEEMDDEEKQFNDRMKSLLEKLRV